MEGGFRTFQDPFPRYDRICLSSTNAPRGTVTNRDAVGPYGDTKRSPDGLLICRAVPVWFLVSCRVGYISPVLCGISPRLSRSIL